MAAAYAASTAFASLSLCPSDSICIPSSSRSLSSFTGLACNALVGNRSILNKTCQDTTEKASFLVLAGEVSRKEKTQARHRRMRRKLSGTSERPRLAVFRSNKHIYVQVIDDTAKHTLAAASTLQPALKEELKLTAGPTIEAARRVGLEVAKVALERGISKVSFDRGGFLYHGKVKAVAEGAREGGLDF